MGVEATRAFGGAEGVVPEEGAVRGSATVGQRIGAAVGFGLLALWALVVIFPFVWMVVTAFKADPEIISSPWSLPAALQWDNFARAWNEARIGRFFLNTVLVLAGSLGGTLLVSAMASYVLARFEFRAGRSSSTPSSPGSCSPFSSPWFRSTSWSTTSGCWAPTTA
jgi:N-acetylglucosamine transport system permease protein